VSGVWGRARARAPEGRGAGGDGTVYIDTLAEEIVLEHLEEEHRRGRHFGLISEEAGEREYGRGGDIVVVDPIDGSHNAKMGIPYFSLTLAASRDNSTMLAPCSEKMRAIASPIPIEAPVTTTTFPASSMSGFYSAAEAKSRDGVGDGVQSKPLLGPHIDTGDP